MRLLSRVSHVIALLAVASCSSHVADPSSPGVALTALPRSLTVGEQKVVSAANDFSFALLKRLSATQSTSNIFASPLSASMALGMTMNGASGATYDQMRSALQLGNATDDEINASYKSLIALLRGLDKETDVRVANSIWYDKNLPVKQGFIDASKAAFDAQVSPLDFASASAPSTINSWVRSATDGAIPTIVDQVSDQVMFLINAIYFKGGWRQQFDVAQTRDAQFHGVAGDEPMKLMYRNGAVRAVFRQDLVGAELFYGDSAYSMVVLIPQGTNSVDALAASLTSSGWASLLANMNTLKLDLFLPRLKLTWDRTLNADLMALGITDAFSEARANFSRMTDVAVVISQVKQKAYVEINEQGTTAAAVTSVGITAVSAPPQIRVDRPFILAIRERLTGTILFVGKIVRMP